MFLFWGCVTIETNTRNKKKQQKKTNCPINYSSTSPPTMGRKGSRVNALRISFRAIKGVGKEPSSLNKNQATKSVIYNHWSQIVCTALGYESFMNHLETEFSLENLLFVTEVKLSK